MKKQLTHRICSKCKDLKEIKDFHKKKAGAGGYNSKCKICVLSALKQRYDSDTEFRQKKIENSRKNQERNAERTSKRKREHYQRNKQKYKDKNDQFYLECKELIKKEKDISCMDCGQRYPYYVMDFDHRDPKEKKFGIAQAAWMCSTIKKVREEIEKCDVVCSNCHRIRTFRSRFPDAHNTDLELLDQD